MMTRDSATDSPRPSIQEPTDRGADSPSIEGTSPETVPVTMRAVVARRYGTAEVTEIEEVPVPSPGPGQVLVRVEAASLNALDWRLLTGTPYFVRMMYGLRRPKRLTPGSDIAGTVVGTGEGVTDFGIGDDIFGEANGGGCAPYAIMKAENVAHKPAGVSFDAAAATPVAGLTALQGLRTKAEVQPGERVLVNGAAGGVGTYAVQIAKAMGAEVTGVCSTRNVEMVGSLGADVVNYTVDDFVARHSISDDTRFDVMVDNVGNRSIDECLSVLRPDGRYVAVSGPMDNPWLDPIPRMISAALRFRRASQSFHQFTAEPNRDDLQFLADLLADGRIVPQIQRVVGLDGVADALTEIGSAHTRAKIIVHPT